MDAAHLSPAAQVIAYSRHLYITSTAKHHMATFFESGYSIFPLFRSNLDSDLPPYRKRLSSVRNAFAGSRGTEKGLLLHGRHAQDRPAPKSAYPVRGAAARLRGAKPALWCTADLLDGRRVSF